MREKGLIYCGKNFINIDGRRGLGLLPEVSCRLSNLILSTALIRFIRNNPVMDVKAFVMDSVREGTGKG